MQVNHRREILYIITRHNRVLFYTLRNKIYHLVSNDNSRVTVFKKAMSGDLGFFEHPDIKIFSLSSAFFPLQCILKILAKKSGFDEIHVDDSGLCGFLTSLKSFRKIRVQFIDPTPDVNLKMLDIGCGGAKTSGAIGMDMQHHEGVDIVCDLNRRPWPLKSNAFDILYCISVIEHLDDVVKTMEELHRIGKNGAVIVIETSHFAHPNSYRDPTHKWHFSFGTFDYFTGEVSYPRYSKLKFKMLKKELNFRKKYCIGKLYAFFSTRRYEKYYSHRCPPHSIYFELGIVKD